MSDSQPKILIATDGSKASFYAAERAVYLAGHMGAKLYVLYAIDKDRTFHAGIHYGEALRELEKAGKEATEKVAALAPKHGVECERLVVEGGRAARTTVCRSPPYTRPYCRSPARPPRGRPQARRGN